jgi:class 3 adenylate cyclase
MTTTQVRPARHHFHARSVHAEPPAARRSLALMFTDIVESTPLLVRLGDDGWMRLLRWHDALVRSLLRANRGREVCQAGDGFFAVFDDPRAAIECGLRIQRDLDAGRTTLGCDLHIRVGIHWAEVLETRGNYVGRGVHEAERISRHAGADEVVATLTTCNAAGGDFAHSEPRPARLRGFPEPVDLVWLRPHGARSEIALAL